MIRIAFIITIFFFSINIYSEENQKEKEIKIDVTGLVCDFCARGIEKIFKKNKKISNIKISLENAQITLQIKNNEDIPDYLIKKIINDNGVGIKKINRQQAND